MIGAMERTYKRIQRAGGNQSTIWSKRRPTLFVGGLVIFLLFLLGYHNNSYLRGEPSTIRDRRNDFKKRWSFARDKDNLMLDEAQCKIAFPRLFDKIDNAVDGRRAHHITLQEIDMIEPKNGYVRAMIYDQALYVLAQHGGIYSRELATLHALHRALLTSPTPLPNVEFVFNTDDVIFESVPLWGYARRIDDNSTWLMPDFGYWAWPETRVGTMREVQIKAVEEETRGKYDWQKKIPRLFWRGATMGLPLRDRLVATTQEKVWADVIALDWHDKESMHHNLKSMPEHCDYKYLVHTEGNSYSGRLKYLQACQSVIFAHKMEWDQHYYHLMDSSPLSPTRNFVEVDRDFNDLESTVEYFQTHDKEARKIAQNSVKTFRERYLTPAAEACYWRYLVHGWAEVSFEPEFYQVNNGTKKWRGLPFETFALERRLDWEPY